jgi:hypothetical protein
MGIVAIVVGALAFSFWGSPARLVAADHVANPSPESEEQSLRAQLDKCRTITDFAERARCEVPHETELKRIAQAREQKRVAEEKKRTDERDREREYQFYKQTNGHTQRHNKAF